METPTVENPVSVEPGDLEMGDEPEIAEEEAADAPLDVAFGRDSADDDANGDTEEQPNSFIDYLRSPVVELVIGQSDEQALLLAHRAFLEKSPYFADELTKIDNDPANTKMLRINLADESLDAVACFLQYQYTGEYTPKRLPHNALEPSGPSLDATGSSLLKHARVYTLAQKLSMPALKTLAHSKIHLVNSTAKGEIAYARYVYGNTPSEDVTIRKPVAAFWATRSHVLRHEAEKEFRDMCLEFPQFGFDVLSLVLDQREKKAPIVNVGASSHETPESASRKGRKRSRLD